MTERRVKKSRRQIETLKDSKSMPRPTPEAAVSKPGTYRVLVRQADRIQGASVITPYAYEEVSEVEYAAYCNNDPNWRAAKVAPSSWFGRAWHRLTSGV